MNSVALTDHGNMFGALDFYKHAKQEGIKPIFGCEVYIADGEMTDRSNRKSFHFVLLAENMEEFLPEYEILIGEYFRSLAEQQEQRD